MFSLKVDDEIKLEPPYENRAEEAFAVVMANYEYLHEWLPWLDETYTLEKSIEFAARNVQEFEDKSAVKLRIIYRDKVAGLVSLHHIDSRDKTAEVGYWVAKEYSGKGLVTKSAARLIEYGFEELKLNRIVIKCVPENTKSCAIPEKLGFIKEGTERDGGWLHARFVDHVVYSMLAREWKESEN
jgi:ribosomal-protein-serine acetyltransferase